MVRALSPDSARIANYLLDLNERVGANNSAQDIADTVNWRRTPQGQGALAELGAMAPPWRRNYLPYNPDPYDADDVRQHRQNRASGSSMPSAPQAPAPLPSSLRDVSPDSTHLLASQPDAFFASSHNTQQNVADQLNQARWAAGKSGPGYTVAEIKPVVASILRSRHEPSGGSVSMSSGAQSAMVFSEADLREALIRKRNPMDFSGPPLPSEHSSVDVDSQATGSTHPSGYSITSEQQPPPSLASSSMAPPRTVGSSSSKGKARESAAPYPSSSQASGSSATPGKRCKHKPGGMVNPPTFIGCDVTDDELGQGGAKAKTAKYRVAKRKSDHNKAEMMGGTTTELTKKRRDDRAARKNLPDRFALHKKYEDDRAASKNLPDRFALQRKYQDDLAARKNLPDRFALHKKYEDDRAASKNLPDRFALQRKYQDDLAASKNLPDRFALHKKYEDDRAASKNLPDRFALRQKYLDDLAASKNLPDRFALRQKYLDDLAASKNLPDRSALRQKYEDDRAAHQLDPTATRHDLWKIRDGERKLAKQLGVSVDEIRLQRRQADPSSPEPSFSELNQRQRTPSPDAGA